MLAQVKKMVGGAAGGDFAGRFAAWWDGKDYVPPAPGEDGAEAKPEDDKSPKAIEQPKEQPEAVKAEEAPAAKAEEAAEPQAKPEEPAVDLKPVSTSAGPAESADAQAVRIRALETLWGEGRLAPGSSELDNQMLDAALEMTEHPTPIGFIGVEGALLSAFAARSDRQAIVAEWRAGCVARLGELSPQAIVSRCEVDRPNGFPEKTLEALVSTEAFAYADHKAGLVGRVHRALTETGRWVFLDTTRNSGKTPKHAFASAWAEPQLATNDEIEGMLKSAGFGAVKRITLTEMVLNAARAGYAHLSSVLENAASNGLTGSEGALFLQELAWEAQSWRSRIRALEGGALEVNLWIADKGEVLELTQPAEPVAAVAEEMLDVAVTPDDAGASDALFEKS